MDDDPSAEDWPVEDGSALEPSLPAWRRRFTWVVAVVVAIALSIVPIYSIFEPSRTVENGLEVCGFDYCAVQEGVRAAGLEGAMSRLAFTYVSDTQADDLARLLTGHLGVPPVRFVIVDTLGLRIAGQYSPDSRTISVERPVRAWIVVHEVAHTVAGGHGEEFQSALIQLVSWLEGSES